MSRAFAFRLAAQDAARLQAALQRGGMSLREWVVLHLNRHEGPTRPKVGPSAPSRRSDLPAMADSPPDTLALASAIWARVTERPAAGDGPAAPVGPTDRPGSGERAGRSGTVERPPGDVLAVALELLRHGPRRGLGARR